MNCKCCEQTREIAVIIAGIATGKYTINDLMEAMRRENAPKQPADEDQK